MDITVTLLSTNKVIKDWNVKEVILPTTTGELGILPNHSELITALDIGVIRVKADSKWLPIVILDGVAEVKKNRLKIFVRQAEELNDIKITLEQAKKELDQNVVALAESQTSEKYLKTINFKKSLARFQALTFAQSL